MIQLEYKETSTLGTEPPFLSLLQIVEACPFPTPTQAAKTVKRGWSHFDILSFTDKKILKAVDPKHQKYKQHLLHIMEGVGNHVQLLITQSRDENSGILLDKERTFLSNFEVKKLFERLVQCENFWQFGHCYFLDLTFHSRNFTSEEKATKTMLATLNYFNPVELEKRGGFQAFESNPYLKTQRIHDGLIVQVGDNPDTFDTPEGEALLIKAIHALPLIKQ